MEGEGEEVNLVGGFGDTADEFEWGFVVFRSEWDRLSEFEAGEDGVGGEGAGDV